jgi:hypothetical protein
VTDVTHFDLNLDVALLRIPLDRLPAEVKPFRMGFLPKKAGGLQGNEAISWYADGYPYTHEPGMRLTGSITSLSRFQRDHFWR